MSKNISVKKNLKKYTHRLSSRPEKSVLQYIRTFDVDMLILNNVVIWEKPTEWFWEFVKTLEPAIQLPLQPKVATNNRGTRFSINGETVPEGGVYEVSPLIGLSVPKHAVYKGDEFYYVATSKGCTGSGRGRACRYRPYQEGNL